jgi:hypothetical protein
MTLLPVSGRYRGVREGVEVELRVDIDGARPMRVVSADYTAVAHGERRNHASMRLDTPKVVLSEELVTISGVASFSQGRQTRKVVITIPRAASANAPATLRHATPEGERTLICVCDFEAARFRRVELEEACEAGIERPPPYDTAALPSQPPARTLTTIDAYAEAGIDLVSQGDPTIVNVSEAGRDAAWSDAELQAAMQRHFTLLGDVPRWAIWLLHARDHTDPRLAGLMFDRVGPQRQGCAVFYGRRPATNDRSRRNRLASCVHELGHGFNLPHCWHKALTTPPIKSRPASPTWMNYPQRFPGGADAYWKAFAFQFDDPEVVHLRHAYRQEAIMGGKAFIGRAARERGGAWDEDRRDAALTLKLTAAPAYPLNFPIAVGLALSSADNRTRPAPRALGPRPGTVNVAIHPPDGEEFLFEPLLEHCHGGESSPLRSGTGVRDAAFIHFGRHGFAFDKPGSYQLQARYTGADGQIALSEIVTLRVLAPATPGERRVHALIGGDPEVGTLLSLMGSRAPELARADAKLQTIIATAPAHPMAAVARLVRGTSLARPFKTIAADGDVDTQPEDGAQAWRLIRPVVDLTVPLRAAAKAEGEEAQQDAFSAALRRIGTRPGISPLVDAFLGSRLRELAAVRGGLVRGRAAVIEAAAAQGPAPVPLNALLRKHQLRAHEKQVAEEQRLAEETRLAEEERLAEEKRVEEEKQGTRRQQPDPKKTAGDVLIVPPDPS